MKRWKWIKSWAVFIITVFLIVEVGCISSPTSIKPPTSTMIQTLAVEENPLPTPAQQLDTLVQNISSDDPAVRLVSIRALENFGDEAVKAVPALRKALFDDSSEIQANAAILLGNLGPKAVDAVPDLQTVLENGQNSNNVRSWAARSLAEIGSKSSVPILANILYVEDHFLAIDAAEAIAKITGEHFRDSGYRGGYFSNQQGVPNIIVDARSWWQEKGQYQKWKGE